MKRIAILYSNYIPLIDVLKTQLKNISIETFTSIPKNIKQYDLIISANYNKPTDINLLKCHHSLLPAFNVNEPEKDAILEGVKVTGITIYFSKTKKIITQYPVFISNDMHYDDLVKELEYLEQVIFPIVINKLINNEPIESKLILKTSSCSNNCGGCNKCQN